MIEIEVMIEDSHHPLQTNINSITIKMLKFIKHTVGFKKIKSKAQRYELAF